MNDDVPTLPEPRWSWLAVLGGAGLALYLGLSLWAFLRHVGPSLKVEHAQHWQPGTMTPVRVELRDEDGRSARIANAGVKLALSAPGQAQRDIGALPAYEMRKGQGLTRAQAMIGVPQNWPEGSSTLHLKLQTPGGVQLDRSCQVKISQSPSPARSAQAIAAAGFLKDADPSEQQPKGYLLELRPRGLLRASLPATLWLRLTDEKGKPLVGVVSARKIAGEFRSASPNPQDPELLVEQKIPDTGLVRLQGTLLSEQVGVQIQVWGPKGKRADVAPKAERKVFVRAFPGASTLQAQMQGELRTQYRSLVERRRASIDIFDAQGRWVAQLDPPSWPSDTWTAHEQLALPSGLLQLEAYSGVRTVQPSIPAALVYRAPVGSTQAQRIKALIEVTKSRIARWPKKEQEPTSRYLDEVAKTGWSSEQASEVQTWLLDTLPPGRFAAPLVQDTRLYAEQELKAFRARWKVRLRWLLWGGYVIYTALVGWIFVRNRRRHVQSMPEEVAPAFAFGASLWFGMGSVLVIATFCVWLLGRLMENLV